MIHLLFLRIPKLHFNSLSIFAHTEVFSLLNPDNEKAADPKIFSYFFIFDGHTFDIRQFL